LLSRYLDNAAETGRTVICVGSGNEGASLGHAAGQLPKEQQASGEESVTQQVELVIADYERTINVQLWKNFADRFDIELRAPTGEKIPVQFTQLKRQEVLAGKTQILIYVGQPSPYSVHQEIFFDFLPMDDYINAGVWRFRLTPRRIVAGMYQFYLPGQEARMPGTRFTRAVPELTLTVPSTSAKVITVGASNALYDAYADFSGRGAPTYATTENVFADTKPDLVAPGVDIRVPTAGGGTAQVSGTSFAAPLVSGTAALLMEWGIVRGNDPYLYGEKMKAVLRAGARPLRGESGRPNERTGYGQLCAVESVERGE